MTWIDLSGLWHAIPDHTNGEGANCRWAEKGLPDRMKIPGVPGIQPHLMELPGTTDDAHIGIPFSPAPVLSLGLDRAYVWDGDLWLEKTVTLPESCRGKDMTLVLERTYCRSEAYLDGHLLGKEQSCAVPHRFPLTAEPGPHRLTLRISAIPPEGWGGHHLTPGSGAKYNGILGKIGLEVEPPRHISHLQCIPQGKNVILRFQGPEGHYRVRILDGAGRVLSQTETEQTCVTVPVPQGVYWSEFTPVLYRASVLLEGAEEKTQTFGLVQYGTRGTHITVNGLETFLRGTHEGCQFPMQGGPVMAEAEWVSMLQVAKNYGLNHIRFHSWCPPEGAFAAADRLGLYVQVEMGGGQAQELPKILEAYGNHPSFFGLTLGNELFNHSCETDEAFLSRRWGNSILERSSAALLQWAREQDPRHLYACTSHPISDRPCADDYYVSAWGRNHLPTVGIRWAGGDVQHSTRFHTQAPNTEFDYREALEGVEKPLLSHEAGQWLTYPDLSELGQYTGVLVNHNYEIIRESLRDHFLLDKAPLFTQASGRLAAMLYKEESEAALRTPGFGGFQLLDLRDYPGQGIATVGILNAFWGSKGTVTPEAFREFCGPHTVLMRMPKRVWTQEETWTAGLEFANFTEASMEADRITLRIRKADTGKTVCVREFPGMVLQQGTQTVLGRCAMALSDWEAPACYCAEAQVHWNNTCFQNHWKFWVYPPVSPVPEPEGVVFAEHLDIDLLERLEQGARVVLNLYGEPLSDARPGCFTTEFWTPRHKPLPPAKTLGLYLDPKHPAFRAYPTAFHTEWQWWAPVLHSKALVLEDLSYGLTPILGVIDNFDTNERLGTILECRMGRGRLLVHAMDLEVPDPSVCQLKRSLYAYVSGEEFKPQREVTPEMLEKAFTHRQHQNREYGFSDF